MWSLFRRNLRPARSTRRTPPSYRPRLEALEDRCLLSAGALDPTFGNGAGYVITPVANYSGFGMTPLVQSDGTIIEVGQLNPTVVGSGPYQAGLIKYNPDGSLDTSFGNKGEVIGPAVDSGYVRGAEYPATDTTGNAGKIVVTGIGVPGSNGEPYSLARYIADGSLDTSFGSNGVATANLGSAHSGGFVDAVIQPDGKILALGKDTSSNEFVLARFNTDGTLDTTFGQGGWIASQGAIDYASNLLLQPNGQVIVTGATGLLNGSPTGFAMARYNADGSLDTSFGTGGLVSNSSLNNAGVDGTGLYPVEGTTNDGKIVVGGDIGTSNPQLALARYNTDGSLDTTFGSGGMVTTQIGSSSHANALTVQGNGQIVAAGYAFVNSSQSAFVARYNPDGSLDTTFGSGGIGQIPTGLDEWGGGPSGVALESNGDIVLAGTQLSGNNRNMVALRYLGDGPSFTVTGFPASVTADTPETITVTALNTDGSVNTGYSGTVHFTSSDPQAVLPADYTFTAADEGTQTFMVTLATAGNQSITATDTNGGIIGSETGISVTPAAASQVVFKQIPTTGTAGQTLGPVQVAIEDAYGNVETGDNNDQITVSVNTGPSTQLGGTLTGTVQAGIATFSNLKLNTSGSYTLAANLVGGTLTPAVSSGIAVASPVSLKFGSITYNSKTGMYSETVTLTNTTSGTLTGPMSLELTKLPSGVVLTDATGTTNGNSYVRFLASGKTLKKGASAIITLTFTAPSASDITFGTEVVVGL